MDTQQHTKSQPEFAGEWIGYMIWYMIILYKVVNVCNRYDIKLPPSWESWPGPSSCRKSARHIVGQEPSGHGRLDL